MKTNIGTVNAMVRITCGLTLLAWSTGEMAKSKSPALHIFCSAMGAQKVAEGITHYCPLTDLFTKTKKNGAED